jgi:TetR/AcrR family transcriptional regulator
VPVLLLEENALEKESGLRIVELRDKFEARLRALVKMGIDDGSIVAVDPKLAVFMLLGAVHWVTKWYSATGPWSAEDASAALIELATRGLAAKPSRSLSHSVGARPISPGRRKKEVTS